MSLVGCPGAGEKPAEDPQPQHAGRAVCSRCGGLFRLRADGRIRMHRVDERDVVPMIRRGLDPAGRLRGRRA